MTRPSGIAGPAALMSVAYDNRLLVKALYNGRLFCFEGAPHGCQPE